MYRYLFLCILLLQCTSAETPKIENMKMLVDPALFLDVKKWREEEFDLDSFSVKGIYGLEWPLEVLKNEFGKPNEILRKKFDFSYHEWSNRAAEAKGELHVEIQHYDDAVFEVFDGVALVKMIKIDSKNKLNYRGVNIDKSSFVTLCDLFPESSKLNVLSGGFVTSAVLRLKTSQTYFGNFNVSFVMWAEKLDYIKFEYDPINF